MDITALLNLIADLRVNFREEKIPDEPLKNLASGIKETPDSIGNLSRKLIDFYCRNLLAQITSEFQNDQRELKDIINDLYGYLPESPEKRPFLTITKFLKYISNNAVHNTSQHNYILDNIDKVMLLVTTCKFAKLMTVVWSSLKKSSFKAKGSGSPSQSSEEITPPSETLEPKIIGTPITSFVSPHEKLPMMGEGASNTLWIGSIPEEVKGKEIWREIPSACSVFLKTSTGGRYAFANFNSKIDAIAGKDKLIKKGYEVRFR